MRIIVLLLVNLVSFQLSCCAQQSSAPQNQDLFELVFYQNEDGTYGVYEQPDSLKGTEFEEYASSMWAINLYYLSHYSQFAKNQIDFPLSFSAVDSIKIKQQFASLLNKDSLLAEISKKTYTKTSIPAITIDEILKITARFIYLHRMDNGEITTHFCVGINEVVDLPQSLYSPFYNAFCFSVILNLKSNDWDYIYSKMIAPSSVAKNISDEELEKLTQTNYTYFEQSTTMRTLILSEYQRLRRYLNFEILLN